MANKDLNENIYNYNLKFPFIGKDKKYFSFSKKFEKIFCNKKIREVFRNNFLKNDNYSNFKNSSSYQTLNNYSQKFFDNSRNKSENKLLRNSSQIYSNKILEIKFLESPENKVNLKMNKLNLYKKKNKSLNSIHSDRGKNKPFLKFYMKKNFHKRTKKYEFRLNFNRKTSEEKKNFSQIFSPKYKNNNIFPIENTMNINKIDFNKQNFNIINKLNSFYKVIKIKKKNNNNLNSENCNFNEVKKETFNSQIIKSRQLFNRTINQYLLKKTQNSK